MAERLPRLFAVRPSADFEIRPIDRSGHAPGPAASTRATTPDGKRPGIFYVNTYDLSARPSYAMDALYLHEAEPGHHFQISIQRGLGELPRFRRFSGFTAHRRLGPLCRVAGQGAGALTDPYRYFGAAQFGDVPRDPVRGRHRPAFEGLDAEQSITYMLANRPVGETVAISETERYIAVPGQALAYKMGELKNPGAQDRAAAALG